MKGLEPNRSREPQNFFMVDFKKKAIYKGLTPFERRKYWPKFVAEAATPAAPATAPLSSATVDQLRKDVNRSLFEEPWKRKQLMNVLTKALLSAGSLHYYQGMHDIAERLLLVVADEAVAADMLAILLSQSALTAATATASLEPVRAELAALIPLIRRKHSRMADQLSRALGDAEPLFALPWILTWFCHSFPPATADRVLDALLSHVHLKRFPLHIICNLIVATTPAAEHLHDFPACHQFFTHMPTPPKHQLNQIIIQSFLDCQAEQAEQAEHRQNKLILAATITTALAAAIVLYGWSKSYRRLFSSVASVTVNFYSPKGDLIKAAVGRVGQSVLDIAHANHVDLEGACESSLACSTCHVIVNDEQVFDRLPEPEEEEEDMLDLAFGLTDTSRLGCQIIMTPELDGLSVTLPSATRNFAVDGFTPKPH